MIAGSNIEIGQCITPYHAFQHPVTTISGGAVSCETEYLECALANLCSLVYTLDCKFNAGIQTPQAEFSNHFRKEVIVDSWRVLQ